MTIEAALAVGTLVAVLAVILTAMSATVLQLRCVDAATEAARFAARDDPDGARRAAGRLVPAGTEILVERQGEDVVARVRATPLGSALPGVRVSAQAVAAHEPSPVAPGEAATDGDTDPPTSEVVPTGGDP